MEIYDFAIKQKLREFVSFYLKKPDDGKIFKRLDSADNADNID